MPDFLDKIKRSASRDKSGKVAGTGKNAPDQAENVEGPKFHAILNGVTGGPAEKRLDEVLNEIRRLSVLLAKKRLLEDLELYRNRVSDFLRIYMDEVLDVKEASGRRRGLRKRQLIVVKRVNVELEELSRLVLGDAPDFKILKELGTIEGLLMDLYR